jgi:hypothetical protein
MTVGSSSPQISLCSPASGFGVVKDAKQGFTDGSGVAVQKAYSYREDNDSD